MYNTGILGKTLFFLAVVGVCGFLHTGDVLATQNWDGIQPQDVVYVTKTAPINEVSIGKGYLIVDDEKFYVADIRRGNKRYKTKLMDPEGSEVSLAFYRRGRMVFVGAIRVPDGRNVAFVIKQLSEREEARVKKGLEYNSSKLMRSLLNSLNREERRILNSSKLTRRPRDDLNEREEPSRMKPQ